MIISNKEIKLDAKDSFFSLFKKVKNKVNTI